MTSSAQPFVRDAAPADVTAICQFGEAHIRPHYPPLIGADAADQQVRRWWNEADLAATALVVAPGLLRPGEIR